VRRKEAIHNMTSSMTALRPPPTLQPPPPTQVRKPSSAAGYRRARIVVVLGLAAACALAALGAITAPAPTGDPTGTVKVVRYAEPTATGRNATRWTPATDATITVRVTEVGGG
jgi:hypothetical protein